MGGVLLVTTWQLLVECPMGPLDLFLWLRVPLDSSINPSICAILMWDLPNVAHMWPSIIIHQSIFFQSFIWIWFGYILPLSSGVSTMQRWISISNTIQWWILVRNVNQLHNFVSQLRRSLCGHFILPFLVDLDVPIKYPQHEETLFHVLKSCIDLMS